MRLIDADSLINLVMDATILGDGFKQAFVAIVNGEPTIEPTIIRCKDCKLFGEPHCLMFFDGYDWAEPDGYCHAAERREE